MLVLKEAQMALLLGVTDRQVRNHAKDGIAVRTGAGEYDATTTVRNLIAAAGNKSGNRESAIDKEREEARLKKEQADNVELKNAKLRKELLPVDEVVRVWSEQISEIRSGLLAVVSRVRQRVSLSAEDAAVLDEEIRDAMTKLSDGVDLYDADFDADADGLAEGDGDLEAAAEDQPFGVDRKGNPPAVDRVGGAGAD